MMHANLRRITTLLTVTTGLTLPGLALAQQNVSGFPGYTGGNPFDPTPQPNVTVQNRPRPDYDPIGLRAGSFFFYPTLDVGGLYDDNVYATKKQADGEFAATVTPDVRVISNWSRHQLTFDVGGDMAFYPNNSSLDYEDFHLQNTGRLDVTQNNTVLESLSIQHLHEDPSSSDFQQSNGNSSNSNGNPDLTTYWDYDANLAYRHDFSRFYTLLGGEFRRLDFDKNNSLDNGSNGGSDTNTRDRNQYLGRARLGYQLSPRIDTFVQGTYDVRRYDTDEAGGFNRDSEGYSLRAGVGLDITSILFGEVSAGYTHRTYDSNQLESFGGFGYAGKITWNVTTLDSLIFEGAADAYETTVVYNNKQASADYQYTISVDWTHELLRNLLLNANIGYVRDDYEGTSRNDNTFLAGGGVTYLINRHLSLEATYDYNNRDSDADNAVYSRNLFRIGVTAKL
jgi:hypothetical protein